MRWSEQQLQDHLEKFGLPGAEKNRADTSRPPFGPRDNYLALGRLKTGEMNKTEKAYADHLQFLQQAGDVLWFKFEGIKLRLADNTFYTADFAVLTKSMEIEIHEVKGFWKDDARVKIKVAASLYPFKFIAVTRKGTFWNREEF